MHFVYILQSLNYNKHYIGSTEDVHKRLIKHNNGGSTWTKMYRPWEIVYTEKYETKEEALKRENQIKKYKGGVQFKKLIGEVECRDGGVVNRNRL